MDDVISGQGLATPISAHQSGCYQAYTRDMHPRAAYVALAILMVVFVLAVLALMGPPITRIYFDNAPRQTQR